MSSGTTPKALSSMPGTRWRLGAQLGGLALLALGVRLVHLDHAPFIDEMNHVLAAQSLLQDGDLRILDGVPYTRARLFTYLVAALYAVFGVSLEVGRVPAVLAGVALVCLLFVWLRRVAGPVAGWVTALLLCFAPISIYLSQWVRFYTLHALVFWIAALGVHRYASGDRRSRVIVATAVALALAFHLQPTTVFGVAGLLVWLAIVSGPEVLRWGWQHPRRAWIAGAVAIAAAGLAAALASDLADMALARFRTADFWSVSRADEVRFYHWLLEDQYGLLWSLWPVMLLLALARAPRAASLFASVFGVALVAHSLAAQKSERYLFYAMPGLFAVWGIGLATLVPWLHGRLRLALRHAPLEIPDRVARWGVTAALTAAGLFAVTSIQAFQLSREMLRVSDAEWRAPPLHLGERYRGEPDWAAARDTLQPLVDRVATVVSTNGLKAVYYLDRVDYVLYAGRLMGFSDSERAEEFADYSRLGRPAISSAASLELLMACNGSGLVVVEEQVLGWSGGVPEETAAFLAEHTDEVPLPAGSRLQARAWSHPQTTRDSRCDGLTTTLRRRQGVSPARGSVRGDGRER